MLIPGASAWTPIASLPKPIKGARASIVGDKIRLTGGKPGFTESRLSGSYLEEVMYDDVMVGWAMGINTLQLPISDSCGIIGSTI